MSLLPDNASFSEKIQAFFLACRGDGVSLSNRDARLLATWEETGVPAEVVIQGIQAGLRKHVFDGKIISRPRSLNAFRREVDSEIRRYLAATAGSASANLPTKPLSETTSGTPNITQINKPSDAPLCQLPTFPRPNDRTISLKSMTSPDDKNSKQNGQAHVFPSDFQRPNESVSPYQEARRRYGRERLEKAEILLRQLNQDFPLTDWEMKFLNRMIDKGKSNPETVEETLLRLNDAVVLFVLRHQSSEIRRQAIRQAKKVVGPRRRLETAYAHAVALHRHLVATAKRMLPQITWRF